MIFFLTFIIFKGFGLFINLLPERIALWIGRGLGRIAFYLDWEHREVALSNLRLAFGQEKSRKEIYDIAKRTFQNLGMMAMEFFRIPRMDVKTFMRKVSIEGLDEAKEIHSKGKGILLLLSHFGNWELMGLMSRVLGEPILVIAKPIKKNEWMDRWINEIRRKAGLEVISTEKASRKVMQALSQNRIVGILIDQRAKRSEGVLVDFFGKKASTTPALTIIAMKTRAPVLPVFMIRDGYQKHRLLIQKSLPMVHTGDIKKDIEANTQLINQTLEQMVRQYPDHWFWVHRRWERKKRR